jgi:hypothetical protein
MGWSSTSGMVQRLTRHWSRRPPASAPLPLSGAAHRQRSAPRSREEKPQGRLSRPGVPTTPGGCLSKRERWDRPPVPLGFPIVMTKPCTPDHISCMNKCSWEVAKNGYCWCTYCNAQRLTFCIGFPGASEFKEAVYREKCTALGGSPTVSGRFSGRGPKWCPHL